MTQPYSIVSSISAHSSRILSSRGALARSYSSRVYSRKPCVARAPVDLDGQVGIEVGNTSEVYKLVRLVLANCLYTEYGRGLRHPLRVISVLASDKVRPNATHTTTITSIIFLGCSGDCEMTQASSAQKMPQSDVSRIGSLLVPPPCPPAQFLFLRCTKASMMFLSALKRV